MPRIFFLSFGGPTQSFHNAVHRICKEAEQFKVFDVITAITDIDLKNDPEFWDKHGKFIEGNARGYGYWLWKSYIVKKQLALMQDGDILVYADAGCTLHVSGKPRLLEYLELAKQHGIVGFITNHIEYKYTKMDLIHHLNALKDTNSGMIIATSFIIQKRSDSIDLVNQWYSLSSIYHLIDDSPSMITNHAMFNEHRHDQSIWSLLCKQYKCHTLPDETWFFAEGKNGDEYPIWASRKKHG